MNCACTKEGLDGLANTILAARMRFEAGWLRVGRLHSHADLQKHRLDGGGRKPAFVGKELHAHCASCRYMTAAALLEA